MRERQIMGVSSTIRLPGESVSLSNTTLDCFSLPNADEHLISKLSIMQSAHSTEDIRNKTQTLVDERAQWLIFIHPSVAVYV